MPAAPLAAGQSPVKFYVTSINQDKLQKASRQKSEVKKFYFVLICVSLVARFYGGCCNTFQLSVCVYGQDICLPRNIVTRLLAG